MTNILRTAKFLPTWGFSQRQCLGLYLTEVPGSVSAPQAQSRVSNINFDIWIFFCGGESLWISHQKYIKDGKVLAHLGFQSKVLAGPLFDWSAWVCFCTSSPQQVVKYQLWYLIFFCFGGGLYKYSMKNILRTEKFLPTWGLNQKYYPGL